MNAYVMTRKQIALYGNALRLEERCGATERKYVGAVTAFFEFLPEDKTVSREAALAWKADISGRYAASTVNVMLSALNRFFAFMSWGDIRVRQLKTQRRIFRDRDRELTKAEYLRLLNAAKAGGNPRLYYLMQTLGATGIRVSELSYFLRKFFREGIPCVFRRNPRLFRRRTPYLGILAFFTVR